GGLRAEDQPAGADASAGRGAAGVQGAEPGGAAVPPPEGAAGGGADVPEEPGAIAGLMCVLVWALMILALMERRVRRELKGQPLYGLYPEGRPSPSPTGPALIQGLSGLCIVIAHEGGETHRRLSQPDPVQRRIIQLLGI